jgi:serine protease AprX
MSEQEKVKSVKRGERRSAAWGKRLSLAVLLLVAEAAFTQEWNRTGKFAHDLAPVVERANQGAAAHETVRLIVQYNQVPKAEHEARVQNLGAHLNHRLGVVKGLAVTIPVSALPALENDPDVVSVGVDHPLKAMDEYTNGAMNVSAAWNAGYIGTGMGVAVIDSGIDDQHIDIWDRVLYHQDFTGTSQYNSQGMLVHDTYGHGTHVGGIIAGSGWVSGQIYGGVAYNANLIDLRVLDGNGSGNDSEVIAAIQQAIALKNQYNIRVINLSLGRGVYVPYAQDPLCQAVESAWKAGIVVVVAAGNYGRISVDGSNGYGTITAPGNDPYVITVGAMNTQGTLSRTDDAITSYSSKGPTMYDHVVKPDLVAPGNQVVSLVAHNSNLSTAYPGNMISGFSNDYFMLSGTSMATPAASGAAVLLLQAHPSLTPDQVKARLMKTAYKTFPASSVASDPTTWQTYTSYYDAFTIGAGYLDLAAAFANTDLASSKVGAALSPSVSYNTSTGKVSLVYGNSAVARSSVVWGSSGVWGTSVVWGTNVSGTSVVWGSSVVWGTSWMEGFSVVWGSTTDTADSVVWGTALNSTDAAMTLVYGDLK